MPVAVGTTHLLSVNIPVYRDGVIPTTVAARRAAFFCWVGTVSDPQVLLDQALHGLPGMAVSLDYSLNSSAVSLSVGAAGAGARTITTDLRNGWSVRTSARINEGGILSHGDAIRWLLTEMTLSGLLWRHWCCPSEAAVRRHCSSSTNGRASYVTKRCTTR